MKATYPNAKGETTFGELALMYNNPRAATVTAVADSRVYTLNRMLFKRHVALLPQTEGGAEGGTEGGNEMRE